MQYLLILSEDPAKVLPEDAVRRTGEFAMELLAKGKLIGGAPLRPQSEARRVRRASGGIQVLDGPFAEAKEVIAGYMVIEAEALGEAVAIATACPNAEFGTVEVREIVPMG